LKIFNNLLINIPYWEAVQLLQNFIFLPRSKISLFELAPGGQAGGTVDPEGSYLPGLIPAQSS